MVKICSMVSMYGNYKIHCSNNMNIFFFVFTFSSFPTWASNIENDINFIVIVSIFSRLILARITLNVQRQGPPVYYHLIDIAVLSLNPDVLSIILDNKLYAVDSEMSPIHWLIREQPNCPEELTRSILRMLIKAGYDINGFCRDGRTPLQMACYYVVNDLTLLKVLVEEGADVNAMSRPLGETPLEICCIPPKPRAVEYLLKMGADPNINADAILDILLDRSLPCERERTHIFAKLSSSIKG